MNSIEIFLYLVIGSFALFIVKRFIESWFNNEQEDEYEEEPRNENEYSSVQKNILNSISTISDNQKLVERSTVIHNHYKTENHYHIHGDQTMRVQRTERVVNPKKLLGSDV